MENSSTVVDKSHSAAAVFWGPPVAYVRAQTLFTSAQLGGRGRLAGKHGHLSFEDKRSATNSSFRKQLPL